MKYLIAHFDPISILTIVVCLYTVASAVSLLRTFLSRRIRTLIMILSLLGILQCVQVLYAQWNLLGSDTSGLAAFLQLLVTLVCLLAIWTLGLIGREHKITSLRLRLAEAEEKPGQPATIKTPRRGFFFALGKN